MSYRNSSKKREISNFNYYLFLFVSKKHTIPIICKQIFSSKYVQTKGHFFNCYIEYIVPELCIILNCSSKKLAMWTGTKTDRALYFLLICCLSCFALYSFRWRMSIYHVMLISYHSTLYFVQNIAGKSVLDLMDSQNGTAHNQKRHKYSQMSGHRDELKSKKIRAG